MSLSAYIGSAAAICTTVAFIPQVWHSWRSRDMCGISLPMYSIFTTGVALWMVYGYLNHDYPVLIANVVTLLLAGIVLVLKLQSIIHSSH